MIFYSYLVNLVFLGFGYFCIYFIYWWVVEGVGLYVLGIIDFCLVLFSKGEGIFYIYCWLFCNFNFGMWGLVVYLCYKVGLVKVNMLVYEVELLGCYLEEDNEVFLLFELVFVFCLFMGVIIECWFV